MALTIKTEDEAIQALLALVFAMSEDDKEAREILYADYTVEDLQRVLRWSIRLYLELFRNTCHVFGANPTTTLKEYLMSVNLQIANQETDDKDG